jgi:hypothetical protein
MCAVCFRISLILSSIAEHLHSQAHVKLRELRDHAAGCWTRSVARVFVNTHGSMVYTLGCYDNFTEQEYSITYTLLNAMVIDIVYR